jgi:hypothetical protein
MHDIFNNRNNLFYYPKLYSYTPQILGYQNNSIQSHIVKHNQFYIILSCKIPVAFTLNLHRTNTPI